jgi:asparagine synthase (glutamine-hydrolysing)
MCRIAGLIDFSDQHSTVEWQETLISMRDSLSYGGPDSSGYFKDEQKQLHLGHRRLSIIDLSAGGEQPMFYKNFVIIFNGEIYNYKEIAAELIDLGHELKSNSDTEVILHAFEAWGKEAVHRFRGMFAFAIWDRSKKKLLLCRDRLGVKPLYWYWKEGVFMFASELKAFHQYQYFDKTIDQQAVSLYLQQGYIPAPHSIYQYAKKLEAGSFLEIDADKNIEFSKYWDVEEIYQQSEKSVKSESELIDELENLLKESFQLRMVADVPVGMFLSGGVDSTLVAAILQKNAASKIKTFTIGFEDKEYNEAHHARNVADYLGTEHHELVCTMHDFEEVIQMLPEIYDEPFADDSSIPTYLLSKMTSNEVKVSLSADGGDELFGGYTKYEIAKNFYPRIKGFPKPLKILASKISGSIDPYWLEKNAAYFPVLNRYKNISNKFPKFRNALLSKDLVDFFNRSSTHIGTLELSKLLGNNKTRFETDIQVESDRIISFLGMIDIKTYLEGDILTKVDRATMQVALEGREPFLDHKLVEFAMSLPDHYKINGNCTKYLLKEVLYKYVPKEIMDRPKQGFSIPIKQWLLGSLKSELEKMSRDLAFCEKFGLNKAELVKTIELFLSQKNYVNPHFVWSLYVLYKWHLRWN